MKKLFIIIALFTATGLASSCSKDNSVTPVTAKTSNDVILSTGDGRPTPPGNSNGGH